MEANRRAKSGGKSGIFVILAAAAVVCMLAGEAYCRTIMVRADGTGDYPTIQEAIDAAVEGDSVVLADGVYTGELNRGLYFSGKAITIRSENGPADCIIKGPAYGFYPHNGEDASLVIDGFTISNAVGIGCQRSSPTITNCIFYNCAEAIRCLEASPIITNCTIRGAGGAGEAGGIFCENGSPVIIGCIIIGNLNEEEYAGGDGIYCSGGSVTLSRCTIVEKRGHGIYLNKGSLVADDCIITNNGLEWFGGGGIYSDEGSLALTNCIISNNRADWGGGIACYASDVTIANCIIAGNSVKSPYAYGGGMFCLGGKQIIRNCTITGNSADYGGAISAYEGNPIITSCILWDNKAPSGAEIYLDKDSNGVVNYTDVQGGLADIYVEPDSELNWGSGNIDGEPDFVEAGYWGDANDPNIVVEPNEPNAVWVEGDYRLLAGSPCIDAGDPNYVGGPNETDLEGNPRIFGDRVDMGAYEFTIFNTAPIACIVGGDMVVEAGEDCEGRVVLDGSCSSDADSTGGTNDDINDFDWYEVIDACEPNSDIYLGSGEVIECNLGLGEHLIILEVTDKAGAFDSNEVVITVEDVTPPELNVVVEPNVLWPPNGKMVEVRPEWEVSDNCDEEVEVSLVDISMNVEGDINDYVEIRDDGSIYLRARKSKSVSGRIYTLTYEAVDDSGNVTEVSATVTVRHRRGPRKLGRLLKSPDGRLRRQIYRRGVQRRGAKE